MAEAVPLEAKPTRAQIGTQNPALLTVLRKVKPQHCRKRVKPSMSPRTLHTLYVWEYSKSTICCSASATEDSAWAYRQSLEVQQQACPALNSTIVVLLDEAMAAP